MARKGRRKATRPGPRDGNADRRATTPAGKSVDVRKITRRAFLTLAILAIPGLIIGMEVRSNQARSDISIIGEGRPVVVQAHDPGCPECRALLENVETAHADFRDTIELRVVNLHSGTGREVASQYDVGRVTLLLFDGSGSLQRIIRGVRSPSELRGEFSTLAQDHQG